MQRKELKSIKDRNEKSVKTAELKAKEETLKKLSKPETVDKVDEWIIDGMSNWIDTFLPGIFNLRLYPFKENTSFHILSNLKRECFLDKDIESIHYLYGSMPTVKIGMLGIVTSVPEKEDRDFDPLFEFDGDEEKENNANESIERAFRGVFRGFDGFEEMVRTCRHPRIMVYPISVYRSIKPNPYQAPGRQE